MTNLRDEIRGLVDKLEKDILDLREDGCDFTESYTECKDQATTEIFQAIIKEIKKLRKDETKGNGRGCTCAAYDASECDCGVDWSDYKLYNEALNAIIKLLEVKSER